MLKGVLYVCRRGIAIDQHADIAGLEPAFALQELCHVLYIIDATAQRLLKISIDAHKQGAVRHGPRSLN
jgi:hypothetical protein